MDIYYIDLNNFSKEVLENFITKSSEKITFSNELKKTQHFAGQFLLEYVLNNEYGIGNFEIEIINGKPFFKNLPYFFSISHSKNIVGMAIGDKNVGFDIEYNKAIRDFSAISARYNKKIDNQTDFYKFWTQHEAKIKLGSSSDSIYHLTGFIDEDFTYTIACNEPFIIYNVRTINL